MKTLLNPTGSTKRLVKTAKRKILKAKALAEELAAQFQPKPQPKDKA